jgi:hypothetical protein
MMTDSKVPNKLPKGPIKGPGLTVPGVVILQFLVIFLAELFEFQFSKVGIITGLAILIAFGGALYLGRDGTSFAAVVTPPIAFFIATLILIATVDGSGLHLSKIGLTLITTLSRTAPFLVIGSLLSWAIHLLNSRKKKR